MLKIQLSEKETKMLEERRKKQKEVFEKISKERLLEIAHAMHTWIFMNCVGEDELYEELGLTDEENLLFGYGGSVKVEISNDR